MAIVAAVIALLCVFCAVFAPWVAPHNPFDLATLNLTDARLPPAWMDEGSRRYLLGTDDQGRDMLSALIYGARISLLVGPGVGDAVDDRRRRRWGCCRASSAARSTPSSCACATCSCPSRRS